jgi:hypothetical protein
MASESFGLGHASDQLIEICCPGMNPIALTGRELRRAKARRNAVKTPAIPQPNSKGFA